MMNVVNEKGCVPALHDAAVPESAVPPRRLAAPQEPVNRGRSLFAVQAQQRLGMYSPCGGAKHKGQNQVFVFSCGAPARA